MTTYESYCKIRDMKGYKDSHVATATGIGKSTFSDWKSGRSKPKNDKLQLIADFFGVSLEYLMTGKDEKLALRIDGLTGFEAILADIYGSCQMEGVMGEYGECLYFSIGIGKKRYALEENDFDRLYHSVKQTIKQMTDLLIKDEHIVREKCKKDASIPFYDITIANAAHERTDIEVTDEMKEHDDAFFDEED